MSWHWVFLIQMPPAAQDTDSPEPLEAMAAASLLPQWSLAYDQVYRVYFRRNMVYGV